MTRALGGEPATAHHGHTGYPADPAEALRRVQRGLPTYWPTAPALVDQRPYRAFADSRGPNSE